MLVALGGGVIGDLAGFAAAIAAARHRLRADPDDAAGPGRQLGRRQDRRSTRAHGKNLIGAFHQPRLVLADTDVLDTPAARASCCAGYAEVVKYGLIGDAGLLRLAARRNGAALLDRRRRARCATRSPTSCRAKARDRRRRRARDRATRALLNLGHTFGHALEAETGYRRRAAARRGGRDRHGAGLRPLGAARPLPARGRRRACARHLAARRPADRASPMPATGAGRRRA